MEPEVNELENLWLLMWPQRRVALGEHGTCGDARSVSEEMMGLSERKHLSDTTGWDDTVTCLQMCAIIFQGKERMTPKAVQRLSGLPH